MSESTSFQTDDCSLWHSGDPCIRCGADGKEWARSVVLEEIAADLKSATNSYRQVLDAVRVLLKSDAILDEWTLVRNNFSDETIEALHTVRRLCDV